MNIDLTKINDAINSFKKEIDRIEKKLQNSDSFADKILLDIYKLVVGLLIEIKECRNEKQQPLQEILTDFVGFLTLNDEIDIEPDKINRYIEVFLQQDNQ